MKTSRAINDEDDEASLLSPLLFGFDFNFTEKIGMELSYDTEITKAANVHWTLASLIYHFK